MPDRQARVPDSGAFHSFLLDQRLLQRIAYERDPQTLTGEDRAYFATWNVLAAIVELVEMLTNVAGWKPWDSVHRGEEAGKIEQPDDFREEGVDVLHFIANLLLLVGTTDEELSAVFKDKQARNLARQRTGYDGSGKDFDKRLPEPSDVPHVTITKGFWEWPWTAFKKKEGE